MATVYKKTTYKELQNRSIEKVDTSTSSSISTVLTNFITYFKAKHLG